MKLRVAFFLILLTLWAIVFSCRRNHPTLVDANRAPDTELWYAPPDSTEYEYLVHLYWRGVDPDGVAESYIWTITDTLEQNLELRWNPNQRLVDFRQGHITSRTDTVISFTAFRSEGGVGLKKNRQAFHIAAIDDNGRIDDSPAVVEFIATVSRLPEIRFSNCVTKRRNGTSTQQTVCAPYDPNAVDTVGMFRPFSISYHGLTTNGGIAAYRFFPVTTLDFTIPGEGEWTEDLSDTIRTFSNVGAEAIPSGIFAMAAQVRDAAGAESNVDAVGYTVGVSRIVVNFEPETELYQVINSRFKGGTKFTTPIDFNDGIPDTVAMGSWVTLFYRGWDNPFDSSMCTDDVNKCITYQKRYTRNRVGVPGANFNVRWLPDTPEDTNPFGTPDSTSMNCGTVEYDIYMRSVDEYGKVDNTPASVHIIGNYNPTLDLSRIINYDGTVVTNNDTLHWDWWKPANIDTLDPSLTQWRKVFFMVVNASGHDHPKDPVTSGVKSWRWYYRDAITGELARFGRGTGLWVDTDPTEALQDTFTVIIKYPLQDIGGFDVDFPRFVNKSYDMRIRGRDTAAGEEFTQLMIVNKGREQINEYSIEQLGRLTTERKTSFFWAMTR